MDSDMDGGASQFAGGGFMPAPSTPVGGQGMGGGSSFSPSAGGRKGASVMYPFTVRHFAACYGNVGGDALTVNSQEINNVVLAGKVSATESRTTDITFLLDDGTGKMEIRKWHDETEQDQEVAEAVRVGSHVKVYGVPRKIGNKITISANSIGAIKDFNEYTCHFLDCIFAFQYSNKQAGVQGPGPQAPAAPSPQRPGAPAPAYNTPSSYQAPSQASRPGYAAPASSNHNVPLHERVLQYFAENEKNLQEGLHRDAVARSITGVSPQAVIEAIDFLVNEGHLYSTIDDVHFRTLENQ